MSNESRRSLMTETLPDRTPTGLFVGGQWLTTAAHLDVVNPATLGTLAQIGDAITDTDDPDLVPEIVQGRVDVVLGSKGLDILLAQLTNIVRRNEAFMYQQQYFLTFHSA